MLELNVKDAKIVTAKGRLVWYQLGAKGTSYYFMAGISLEKMAVEDAKKWVNFIKNIA